MSEIRWIPVTERIPDSDRAVLLYVPDENADPVWIGHRDGPTWRWPTGFTCFPTHWAELPEPPAEEGE